MFESIRGQSLSKAEKIELAGRIVGSGFLCAIIFHVLIRNLFHKSWPWTTFLYEPNDRFMDLLNTIPVFEKDGFSLSIFPTTDWLYLFLSMFGTHQLFVFLALFTCYYATVMYLFLKDEHLPPTKNWFYGIILAFLSYPVIFAVDRANIETYMFILISSFVFLYQRGRVASASVFLALAIGLKAFPAVFGVLYLRDKKYKELGLLIVCLVALALSLFLATDIHQTKKNADAFFELYFRDYIIGDAGLRYGHSLFAFLKTTLYFLMKEPAHTWLRENSTIVLRCYTAFTFMVYGSFAALVYFNRRMPYWHQIAILTFLFCFLPNISADYKLLHVLTPMLLFFNASEKSPNDKLYVWLFGLLIIPKAYFNFPSGGTLSTLVMPMLFAKFLYELVQDNRMRLKSPIQAS